MLDAIDAHFQLTNLGYQDVRGVDFTYTQVLDVGPGVMTLIPELRIYGGVREYGIDDNLLVTTTNQFGIEETEDYRLPDRIRNMGYLGIALEWPLAELVYDEELVDISRERRYYFRDRRRLVTNAPSSMMMRIGSAGSSRPRA